VSHSRPTQKACKEADHSMADMRTEI